MTAWEIVLVARVPAAATSPTLTVVDRLVFEKLSYTHELNRPGSAMVGCPIRSLSSAVKTRLADLDSFPSEVWVYTDSILDWAGEIQTLAVQDQSVNLGCVGLLGYTWRMGVTSDLTYTATDQFTIVKNLVDHWQGLSYGHYGIDTSTVGTSGVTRDRTYLRNELHNIGQRLQELGAVSNGFDTRVDPTTRKLVLAYPQSGTDLSASLFFDARNIDSANIAISVAPDDLVSDVSATGSAATSGGTNTTLYSARSTAGVQSAYGRSWNSATFDGVSVQATLDGHADAYLAARSAFMLQPGVTIIPKTGADIHGFHVGDTCTYSFDAGLGLQTLTPRIAKLTVDVDEDGKKRFRIEFT
ncbi:MAG: hypothetical protein M3460_17605 [Actinomycetota bacterium]|nr:hypothetical protein [Actinomycetota bacterium]